MTGHFDETSPASEVSGVASSPDGRSFRFNGSHGHGLRTGGLVSLRGAKRLPCIGQIQYLTWDNDGGVAGTGRILGSLTGSGSFSQEPLSGFSGAQVFAADRKEVDSLHTSANATMDVGTLTHTDGFPAQLIPAGFNRHTFWCGQSGSGKTYSLGVVLEELLLKTGLPLVIFDPNADFVHIDEPVVGTPVGVSHALKSKDIRILRPNVEGTGRLRARFSTMSMRSKAAVLRLDPTIDRAEYNVLLHLDNILSQVEPEGLISRLRASDDDGSQGLASRIENLMLLEWRVWAGKAVAASEVISERPDATVLDLGGFEYQEESLVIALSVLDALWDARESRSPVLLVIDEAHNLCGTQQDSPLHRVVRDRIAQIAAEGRKFGLWLLLSTQRPSKVDRNVTSQCDNLALMRMSSPGDLDELETNFGQVPRSFIDQSMLFRRGEALMAGGFAPAPSLITVRNRFTKEGGSDVAVPLVGTRHPR